MSQLDPKVVEAVNTIMREKFEVPAEMLVPSALLKEDLRLDSLDFVDMFVMLEQQKLETPQDLDFLSIRTLGDIYQLVASVSVAEVAP